MATDVSLFDYTLPPDLIAQSPAEPRESAKLMALSRTDGTIRHEYVSDFPNHLSDTDILVINNTKVFKARLIGSIKNPDGSNRTVELFLIRPRANGWMAIGKPGKKLLPGTEIILAEDFRAIITEHLPDGTLTVDFGLPREDVISRANRIGHVPVPPYVKNEPDANTYQTAYAKITGSVAAPTAGFHLTPAVLDSIKKKGVQIVEITLHVGLGTFLPVKTETLESHTMHSEWVSVSPGASDAINQGKRQGKRIVAVGTTTVRTLEGVAALHDGNLVPYEGDINLFIMPGFTFHIVDALLTNFHLPKSTLIVLVSAFAGREHVLTAYNEAVSRHYRFYSFGDAMFIS